MTTERKLNGTDVKKLKFNLLMDPLMIGVDSALCERSLMVCVQDTL